MTRRLHLFALPQPSHRATLDRVLLQLAERHRGPRFAPHMTLYAGDFDDAVGLTSLARDLARQTEPWSMVVREVGSGREVHKCVFLRLAPSPLAEGVTERVRELALSKDYTLDPHVSLLYQDLPPSEAAGIADAIAVPLHAVRFTELLVNERTGNPGPVDPSTWRTLLRLPLSPQVGQGR